MKVSIILLLLIKVALFEHNSTVYFNNGLIYNGKILNTEDYPYIVYIKFWNLPRSSKTYGACTGSLLNKFLVLTAGHCCVGRGEDDIEVYLGSPLDNNDFRNVVKIYLHENYCADHDDICILKMEKDFPKVKTFSKLGGSAADFKDGNKLKCTMIGFGLTANKNRIGRVGYMMTNDVLYGREACKDHFSPRVIANWKQYLCLVPDGESSICVGDSGGPMICNNLQYGVCSFIYGIGNNGTECGQPHQQSIYIATFIHEKWLKNIIQPEKQKKKKKKSSGNLLKPRHYTLHIIVLIVLCNMLNFI